MLDPDNTLFVRVRRLDGFVMHNIALDHEIRRVTPVPSLGYIVDRVLQVFGYDSSTCYFLWHAYTHAANCFAFLDALIARHVPLEEACWYWETIVVSGAYRNHTDYI